MTNFVDSLKSEIARIARKELKPDVLALRKTVGAQRTEIAALKRQLRSQASQINVLLRKAKSGVANAVLDPAPVRRARVPFGPATLTNFRARLGLTQVQVANLIGASALSVRRWEAGKAQPRSAQLVKIAGVVKLGKRAVIAQLNR